jgi:hypothetical protein
MEQLKILLTIGSDSPLILTQFCSSKMHFKTKIYTEKLFLIWD